MVRFSRVSKILSLNEDLYEQAYDYDLGSGTHASMHDHVDVEVRISA